MWPDEDVASRQRAGRCAHARDPAVHVGQGYLGGRVDNVVLRGSPQSDLLAVDGTSGRVRLAGWVTLLPDAALDFSVLGGDGDDDATISGPVPFRNTTIDGGSPDLGDSLAIEGPTGPVGPSVLSGLTGFEPTISSSRRDPECLARRSCPAPPCEGVRGCSQLFAHERAFRGTDAQACAILVGRHLTRSGGDRIAAFRARRHRRKVMFAATPRNRLRR